MSRLLFCARPVAAIAALIGLGLSLSGCIVVVHRPGYCYYHPYHAGC